MENSKKNFPKLKMILKNLSVGWTGVNSSGNCILCKEPDKPTKEWQICSDGKTFFACDNCLEGK